MCVCVKGICVLSDWRGCAVDGGVLSGHAVRGVLSLAGDDVLSGGTDAVHNRKKHHNTPDPCGQTDRCKNITLPQTSFANSKTY